MRFHGPAGKFVRSACQSCSQESKQNWEMNSPALLKCKISSRRGHENTELRINDHCWAPDRLAAGSSKELSALNGSQDSPSISSTICGNYRDSGLSRLLSDMPKIRSLTLIGSGQLLGMSWDALSTLMSVPGLRSLDIRWHLFKPDDFRADWDGFSPAPLTTFRYYVQDCRPLSTTVPMEEQALGFTLDKLRASLQNLILDSEGAPLHTLAFGSWPRLRVLRLSGNFPTKALSKTPWCAVLGQMTALRILYLQLYLPEGEQEHTLIWPPDAVSITRWLELEELTMTNPDPHDQVYAHTPLSLRTLSLECCPRYVIQKWQGTEEPDGPSGTVDQYPGPRRVPILHASEMQLVLGRCDASRLQSLKIEYYSDHAEDSLLAHIVIAFPGLEFLRLVRYADASGNRDELGHSIATRISRSLSPLTRLRTLQVHLDVSIPPKHPSAYRRYSIPVPTGVTPLYLQKYTDELNALADIMALMLAPSVEWIWMLYPDDTTVASWAAFRIVRGRMRSNADESEKSRHAEEVKTEYVISEFYEEEDERLD
ncbi:hypothetical protein C8Q79DRAFT_565153 [Trametes meyenii]|nr:hypothetical protein C8Q79DRAFT_565153 [Trametes meyenii]